MRVAGNPVLQDIYAISPGFRDLFEPDVIAGNLDSTVADASSIALREDTALTRFGTPDIIGKVVTLVPQCGDTDLRIGGVYRETARNSVLVLPIGCINFTVLSSSHAKWLCARRWARAGNNWSCSSRRIPARRADSCRRGTGVDRTLAASVRNPAL